VGTVYRTARVGLRVTSGQRRRLLGLLIAAGDVWAALIDMNRERLRRQVAPIVGYAALCRELAGCEDLGELDMAGARSVLRRYTAGWFESNRRKKRGEQACYPRRKRRLFPVRWYHGTFDIEDGRVRIPTARGCPPLQVRLARDVAYPLERVRSVTLVADAGRLWLDVTAALPIEDHGLDQVRVARVDVGIIHPFAVAADDEALVVSGRAIRAESRLHLDDTRQRGKHLGRKAPKRGQKGSRRWRKLRARQRKQEARHRRRVRQAHHQAAKQAVAWAVDRKIGTLVVGDPTGITHRDAGGVHNLRLRQWRRTLTRALRDKAQQAGIRVVLVDERGTSSTCPDCRQRVPKPNGRTFCCPHCGQTGHRDIVGARNIATNGGGLTRPPARVEHRRAGIVPARRDRRRHRWDKRQQRRRSCPAPGRPPPPGEWESLAPTARTTEPTGPT
jgi:IS605 OrfB family transposase